MSSEVLILRREVPYSHAWSLTAWEKDHGDHEMTLLFGDERYGLVCTRKEDHPGRSTAASDAAKFVLALEKDYLAAHDWIMDQSTGTYVCVWGRI